VWITPEAGRWDYGGRRDSEPRRCRLDVLVAGGKPRLALRAGATLGVVLGDRHGLGRGLGLDGRQVLGDGLLADVVGLDGGAGVQLGGARRPDAVHEADHGGHVVAVQHEHRAHYVRQVQREDAGLRLDVDGALVHTAEDECADDLVVLQHLVEQRLLVRRRDLRPEHVAFAGADLAEERRAEQVVPVRRRLGGQRVALEHDQDVGARPAHHERVQDLDRGLVVQRATTG